MCSVAVTIPDAVLFDTRMTSNEAQDLAKRMTALGLYKYSGVSLGYCCEIAGMHKSDFMQFLGQNGVSIFHFDSEDEFAEELANAEAARNDRT